MSEPEDTYLVCHTYKCLLAQERQRASMGSNHSNQIVVIPAAAKPQRTAKYIYAKIRGLPIVTEQWIHACATSHRLMPLHCQKHSKEVVRGASEAHEVFKGCRIFLAGPDASVGALADLVQHAGKRTLTLVDLCIAVCLEQHQ